MSLSDKIALAAVALTLLTMFGTTLLLIGKALIALGQHSADMTNLKVSVAAVHTRLDEFKKTYREDMTALRYDVETADNNHSAAYLGLHDALLRADIPVDKLELRKIGNGRG